MEIFQSRRSLAVMTGMEKPNDHAEPLQSNAPKKGKGKKENEADMPLAWQSASSLWSM